MSDKSKQTKEASVRIKVETPLSTRITLTGSTRAIERKLTEGVHILKRDLSEAKKGKQPA